MSDSSAHDAPSSTLADARRALRAGETTCEALAEAFLERVADENESLNALLHVGAEGALSHARYLDGQVENGNAGPLAGLVLAVKDVISVRGERLTCASKMLEGFTATYDAAAARRLREAGALFIGRANCDEFAMGSSNESSRFGPASHPESEEHVPGGSSGGAAAAVAAGFCHAALDSDTGGSLRQPAAFCGLVGLKPTYGRVPRHGLTSHASSLDCVGPITRTVEDAAHVLNVIAGEDARDATSAPAAVPDYPRALGRAPEKTLDGLRVGVAEEHFDEDPFARALSGGVREQIEAQADALSNAGVEIVDVSLPHAKYGLAAYYVLAPAEASSNLARYDGVRYGHRAGAENGHANGSNANGERVADASALERMQKRSRSEGFGEEVRRRILLGTHVLSAGARHRYYEQARKVRTLIKNDYDRVFDPSGGNAEGSDDSSVDRGVENGVDVLLTPATPTPAFRKGSRTGDPLSMARSDLFTVGPSLAGLPALTVPVGRAPDEPHLPVGAQLVGRAFDEALLLQVGEAVEKLNTGD